MKKLIIYIIVSLTMNSFINGQFIIENPSGDINTAPIASDVNVCFYQDAGLSFRLIASSNETDPVLTITLATGREYIDNTINIKNSLGTFSLGPNIGSMTEPKFVIQGSFAPGDFVEIEMDIASNCEAMNQSGVTHTIEINGDSEVSTTHDASFLTLSLSGFNSVSASIGSSETLEGEIIGGGNGCVEELVLILIDDKGVSTTELRVEGNVIVADSIVADSMYYTIGQAEILKIGDGDSCLESLEVIEFERDVDVTSCEVDAAYKTFWGCNGERCIETDVREHDISLVIGIPRVEATENIGSLDIWCEDSGDFTFTFTNNGSEPEPGTGGAYNIEAQVGWDWNNPPAPNQSSVYLDMPWCDFKINGVDVSDIVYDRYYIRLSELTPGLDIDGPGGLEDLDGDNVYDDLPVGASFDIDFTIKYPSCDSTCNTRITYRRPTYLALFEDQCEAKEPIGEILSPSLFWVERNGQTDNGPTDMNDGDVGTFEFFIGQLSGGFIHHIEDTTELRIMLPEGLCLAPVPNAMFQGDPSLIYEVKQDGTMAVIKTKDGWRGTYSVDFILKCDEVVSNDLQLYWELYHLPNDGGGACCSDFIECDSISISAHCPIAPCPGPQTLGFDATRMTFGHTDETQTVPITEETASQLDIVFRWDTFRINSESRINSDLDELWVDVSYTNQTVDNPFDFRSGTFEVWDDSEGIMYTCPMTDPASVIDMGGGSFVMRFDATHLIGSCLPSGFIWSVGDSANMEAILRFNGAGAAGNTYEFGGFRAQHEGIAPGMTDTLACDNYGTRFSGTNPTFSSGGGTVFNRSGCTIYGLTFARNGQSKDVATHFPGEYRPVWSIDSASAIVPDYLEYIPGSATYFYRVEPGIGSTTISISDPEVESLGDGTSRYTFYKEDSWIPSDENNNGACCVNQLLQGEFQATCDMPGGITRLPVTGYFGTNLWDPTEEIKGERVVNRTFTLNYTPPDLNIQPITQDVLTTTTDVVWEVELCNTSLNDDLSFTWFLFENESGEVTLDSVIYNVFDDMGNQIAGPNMAVVNTEACSGGSDYMIQLDDLGQGECIEAKIYATSISCDSDISLIKAGWNCTGYPMDVCEIDCMLEDTLSVTLLNSQVQIEMAQEAAPYDICTEIDDTITITSALDAYITDLLLCIPLPNGMTESDLMAEIEYPAESGVIEIVSINIAPGALSDTVYVDLMQHPDILGQNGIPGTQDAGTAQEAQARVFLTWLLDCDFLAGDTYEAAIYANRPCGNPVIDNGVSTESDPLNVVGVNPPFLSVIEPELSIDTMYGCMEEMLSINTTIIIGTSTPKDSIFITLPPGLLYVDGSYMCELTAPADTACPVIVEVREIGNNQIVVLAIPPGINSVTELPFYINVIAQPEGLCDEIGIVEVEAISSVGGIYCPTTDMDCSSLGVLTGQAKDTLYFVKTKINIDSVSFCQENGVYMVGGELSVRDLDISEGDSLLIEVFCSSDLSEAITTIEIYGPIMKGTQVAFEEMIDAACVDGDNLYLSLDPINGNCICEPMDTLIDIVPETVVEVGQGFSICQTKTVDITQLGASITGAVTTGVWSSDGDGIFMPSEIFSEAMIYVPGASDIEAGSVVLRLTSDDNGTACDPDFEEAKITIIKVDCGNFPWDGK